MTLFQSILLGIIQGLTEFIPVSSTAHLLLTQYLLGWQIPEKEAFSFNVLVQLGTLAALIVYFRADLWQMARGVFQALRQGRLRHDSQARLVGCLILGTIPALAAGALLKDWVERLFSNPGAAAIIRLMITIVLLLAAERLGRSRRGLDSVTWKDALWVGCFQILSVFPGASRSGSTIAGGMTRHLDRSAAARFAFLLSIPVMLAAGAYEALDLLEMTNLSAFLPQLLAGFMTAAVVGYLAIRWLLAYLARRPLYAFALYCAALSIVLALWLIF